MPSLNLRASVTERIRADSYDAVIGPLANGEAQGIRHTLRRLLCEPRPARQNVLSLLNVAVAVFAADKTFSRSSSPDRWTRKMSVSVPVSRDWLSIRNDLEQCVSFVSGDEWSLRLRPRRILTPGKCYYRDGFTPDAVCLFSGGSDSLIGAIDLLEAGNKLILVGHHDFSFNAKVQSQLHDELARHYGDERLRLAHFDLKVTNAGEDSTRSRSLLFMALGLAVAS